MIRSLYKLLLHDDEGIINIYIIAVVVLPLTWKMSRPSRHVHTVVSAVKSNRAAPRCFDWTDWRAAAS
jgi:hypothetical protein